MIGLCSQSAMNNLLDVKPSSRGELPTMGALGIVPLVPLLWSLGAWLALPIPSFWLLRTILLGCAIQFARRPPRFSGVLFTSVRGGFTAVLLKEISNLLAKAR